MVLFLVLLVAVAIALGIIGLVAKTFFYLLIIGVIFLVIALLVGGLRVMRGGNRRSRR